MKVRHWAAVFASVVLATVVVAGAMAPRPITGGPFEASGVIHVPGTNGVLFVDDGRAGEIFWMELGADGTQAGAARPVSLAGASITDLEGITFDGHSVYVVGSQSKTTGFDGDGLARFVFDPATRQIQHIERVQGLKRWLAGHVTELHGTVSRIGDEVLNIEAIAWDPRQERLLLGLRAPVIDGQALVIPLTFRDKAAPFTLDNLVAGAALHLPLQGAGIRSLEFDDAAKRFRLISGAGLNAETRDFRVLEWDGTESPDALRETTRFPRSLKPEGLTTGMINGRVSTIVVFDTGRYALLD